MRKMKSILLILAAMLIFLLFFASACSSPQEIANRKCAKAQSRYQKASFANGCPLMLENDTVLKLMTIRTSHDTTIFVYLKGDTIHAVDTVFIIKGLAQSKEHRLDLAYAYSIAYVSDGLLFHSLIQKPSAISKTIKNAIVSDDRYKYLTITRTVTKTTNFLSSWQQAQIWIGRILGILLLLMIGFTTIAFIRKTQSR